MKLFAIADLHLSFGSDKPMDIFRGWQDHAKRIEENWQKKVSPEDTVVLPGDLSWAMDFEQLRPDMEFLHRLNGTKIISKGNHDYWWSTRRKMENFLAENGFDSVKILHNNHFAFGDVGITGTRGWVNDNSEKADEKVIAREALRLEMSVKSALSQGLRPVAFLHYPPVYGASRNTAMLEMLGRYGITQVFYGHLHGNAHKFAIQGNFQGVQYHLIASDFLQFDPMEITKIVQSDNL